MKLLTLILLLCAGPAWGLGTARYDDDIRAASERWLPGQPWLRYRALLYQESRLQPEARSPVGAEGIAQFMPGTWAEVSRALGYGAISPRAARPAIHAGAYYLAGRMRVWAEPRPWIERRRKGEACYNAGCGHIIAAQRLCRRDHPSSPEARTCLTWYEVEIYLPRITGSHAAETRDYVRKIEHWERAMRAGGLR